MHAMKELPNILTIARIVLIPVILSALYLVSKTGCWVAAILFALASITDYFDGALARSLDAQTSFGRVLDPIADKLLVASTLMMLVYLDRAPLVPAILILCREIVVSGLREYLSEFKVSIPVSNLAKIKTGIQFVAILILILGQQEVVSIPLVHYFGQAALWIAAMLTIFTGFAYMKEGFKRVG